MTNHLAIYVKLIISFNVFKIVVTLPPLIVQTGIKGQLQQNYKSNEKKASINFEQNLVSFGDLVLDV